jgi:hypothetical protein
LATYYHNPTRVAHIGETLIGHEDRDMGEKLDVKKEKIIGGIASIPARK